ncbi:MAG: hypothetical protein HY074_04895 [Deltaproteobacteria bacterium]|nr:hypothetical protein [Deltaproteobacteria bacterium]
MKPVQFIAVLFVAGMSLSWVPIRHLGLLTDDNGIVTAKDLAEEEERCSDLKPFPPEDGSCFQYWQCLSSHDVHVECDDISEDLGEDTAEAVFWIKDGDHVHHYLTRRNFDLEACREWKEEWTAVLGSDDVVCLSGEFVGTESADEHPSSPAGSHFYWIIDRMKTHSKEWSYFHRGDADAEEQD